MQIPPTAFSRALVDSLHPQLGQTRQMIRVRYRGTGGQYQPGRLGEQPTPDEPQHLR